MAHYWLQLERMRRSVQKDPERHRYTDAALAPVAGDDTDTLEMFTHNEGARNEVARTRRIDELTHRAPAASADVEA